MVMLFNAILTVSQFQFIKPFCTGVHLPTPSLSITTIIWYHELPVDIFSYCSYCIVKVHWWFTYQRISSDLMTHFCSPACSQPQLCLPIRGWEPCGEQEQKSLNPVFRRASTSSENGYWHVFILLKTKIRKDTVVLYHFIWVKHDYNPIFV